MSGWQLQQSKQKLSEVIKLAKAEGPQKITQHGGIAHGYSRLRIMRKF